MKQEFRRHVQEHLNDGWDLYKDHGDRVIVKDRGTGSLPIHGGLLFSTLGGGNLMYFVWSYEAAAETRQLTAGDSPEPFESEEIRRWWAKFQVISGGFISSLAGLGFALNGALGQPPFGLATTEFILLLAILGVITGFLLQQFLE